MNSLIWVLGLFGALAALSGRRPTSRFLRKGPQHFPPYSLEARELFRAAAEGAGYPTEWADSPDLHYILQRESDGWVGRPNYTFGNVSWIDNRDRWPEVWAAALRDDLQAKSSATGLGQLLWSNADKHQPMGREGYGVPIQEAVGMLSYIKARYGTPAIARDMYGRTGTYSHPTKGTMNKSFQEGY